LARIQPENLQNVQKMRQWVKELHNIHMMWKKLACVFSPEATVLFRVAMVREGAGKIKFYSRSGKSQGVFYQVRELLVNPCSKSVKSEGILS